MSPGTHIYTKYLKLSYIDSKISISNQLKQTQKPEPISDAPGVAMRGLRLKISSTSRKNRKKKHKYAPYT